MLISIILESIDEVNRQLEKGSYVFTDIKKEGILLYDSGEFTLSKAKDLSWSEMKEIVQDYYEYWFDKGKSFLDCKNLLEKGYLNKCAFELHQATESFYSTILLVFSNYKPKLHDIKKLGSRAKNYNSELLQVFPIAQRLSKKNVSSYCKKLMLMRDMIKTIKLAKSNYFI